MKKGILLLIISAFAINAFAQDLPKGFEKNQETGVLYKFERKNDEGRRVVEGDVIIGRFWIKYGDSVINDGNRMHPQPIVAASADARVFEGDLVDGLLIMREGEICEFAFPRDSIAKLMPQLPDYFTSDMYAFWKIEINELRTHEEMMEEEARMREEQERLMAERSLMADSLKRVEPERIEEGLRTYGISNKMVDGVYFKQEFFANNNIKIEDGDQVKVHYVGRFLDGSVFDTSVEEEAKKSGRYQSNRPYTPLEFTVGKGMMIKGFEAGVKMMSLGDKAMVLIPSHLAYGDTGRGDIPPASPLIFELEIIDIIKAN